MEPTTMNPHTTPTPHDLKALAAIDRAIGCLAAAAYKRSEWAAIGQPADRHKVCPQEVGSLTEAPGLAIAAKAIRSARRYIRKRTDRRTDLALDDAASHLGDAMSNGGGEVPVLVGWAKACLEDARTIIAAR